MNDTDLTVTATSAHEPRLAAMRPLGQKATKVFRALVDGVSVGDAKKLDNARSSFIAVSIDYLHGESRRGAFYAIAHRHEVNGDLVPDPDVEFYVVDDPLQPGNKAIYPTAIDHGPIGYYRYVHFDSNGHPARIAIRGQADLARFCDGWMTNIAAQQKLVLS